MMRHWREREFERHLSPAAARYGLGVWAFFAKRPTLYRLATDLAMRALELPAARKGASPGCRSPAAGHAIATSPRRRARPSKADGGAKSGSGAMSARDEIFAASPLAARDGRRGAAPRGGGGAAARGPARNHPGARAGRRGGARRRPSRPRPSARRRASPRSPRRPTSRRRSPAFCARTICRDVAHGRRRAARARCPGERPRLKFRAGASDGHDLNAVSAAFAGGGRNRNPGARLGPGQPDDAQLSARQPHRRRVRRRSRRRLRERLRETARRYGAGAAPRTLNFITGPSRSADIEQTLLLGAHGPRRLHIVVVGASPEAGAARVAAVAI